MPVGNPAGKFEDNKLLIGELLNYLYRHPENNFSNKISARLDV